MAFLICEQFDEVVSREILGLSPKYNDLKFLSKIDKAIDKKTKINVEKVT